MSRLEVDLDELEGLEEAVAKSATIRALIEVVRAAQALFDLDSAAPDQTVGEFRTERLEALATALQPFTTPTERGDNDE